MTFQLEKKQINSFHNFCLQVEIKWSKFNIFLTLITKYLPLDLERYQDTYHISQAFCYVTFTF